MKAAVQIAASRTTTGTQDITVSGFGTPKAALVIVTPVTTLGTRVDNASISIGVTDGTNQWRKVNFAEHSPTTSDTYRASSNTAIGVLLDGNGGTIWAATFNSWITDGIRINVTNTDGNAYQIHVVLFGGSDLSIVVGTQDLGTGTSPINVTTLGTQADFVLLAGIGLGLSPTATTQGLLSFGCAVPGGAQRSWDYRSVDNVGNADVMGAVSETFANGQINSGARTWGVTVGTHASGFTLTPNASADNDVVGYLAFASDSDVWVGSVDSPTSTASDWNVTGPGWQPQFALLGLTFHTGYDSVISTDRAGALGIAATDGTREFCAGISDDDGAAFMDTSSQADDQFINFDDFAGAQAFDLSSPTFNSSGWTVAAANINAANGTTRKWWGFAIRSDAVDDFVSQARDGRRTGIGGGWAGRR